MIARIVLLVSILGSSGAPPVNISSPFASARCPTDAKLTTLLAGSDIVLVGKMEVPKQRLVEEARNPSPEYMNIPIQVVTVVKGVSMRRAIVRFYPHDAPNKPSNDTVLSLAGMPVILFLTQVDDGPVGGLYFAGNTPDALKQATDLTVAASRAEASRQAQVIAFWRATATLPHFAKVRALIARLGQVSGDQQQRVFDQLEALGEPAVPAIIAQMDDQRALRTQAISLVNHAKDAFEGMRYYRPQQVVDGLDAVLNQITGESFGSIANGGSDRQRAATVAGWRVYAADMSCKDGR